MADLGWRTDACASTRQAIFPVDIRPHIGYNGGIATRGEIYEQSHTDGGIRCYNRHDRSVLWPYETWETRGIQHEAIPIHIQG